MVEAGRIGDKEVSPMLRLRKDQPSLWESLLPEEALQLSEELSKVNALLEDEHFFARFREKFALKVAIYLEN